MDEGVGAAVVLALTVVTVFDSVVAGTEGAIDGATECVGGTTEAVDMIKVERSAEGRILDVPSVVVAAYLSYGLYNTGMGAGDSVKGSR